MVKARQIIVCVGIIELSFANMAKDLLSIYFRPWPGVRRFIEPAKNLVAIPLDTSLHPCRRRPSTVKLMELCDRLRGHPWRCLSDYPIGWRRNNECWSRGVR